MMNLEKKYQVTKDYLEMVQEELREKEEETTNTQQCEELKQELEGLKLEYETLKQDHEACINKLKNNRELEEEIEIISETKEEYKNNLYEEKAKNRELEEKLREAERTNKHIKETVRKPVTINDNLDLFGQIKEGTVVSFLKPTKNSKRSQFQDSPIFEYDNKGAIYYQRNLIGMYEKREKCIKYYQQEHISINAVAESVLFNVLGIKKEALDCKLKYGTGSGKSLKWVSMNKILSKEPCYNKKFHKFESNKHYQYIYTENDGSRYIIKKGQKEYI